jgi:hypothetical protein
VPAWDWFALQHRQMKLLWHRTKRKLYRILLHIDRYRRADDTIQLPIGLCAILLFGIALTAWSAFG